MGKYVVKWHGLPDGCRCGKWCGRCDIRSYRPPEFYDAYADYTDTNPVTGERLEQSEWWLFLKPGEV